MALAKKYRIPSKDFGRIFKNGKTVRGSFFFIRFVKNDLGHGRAAIVVSSKILKKATARNRFKRIMTEAVSAGPFLKKSYDIVAVATPNVIVDKPRKEIKRDLEQTMNKIFSQ